MLQERKKTTNSYLSAPLMISEQNLEQSLEKNLNDVISFINSINSIREKLTYLGDKIIRSEKKLKKLKSYLQFQNHLIHLVLLLQHQVLLRYLLQEWD